MTHARNTMDKGLLTRIQALAAEGHTRALDFDGVAARVATDWFASIDAPDDETIELYKNFMLKALERTDAAFAARIADRLAPNRHAPLPVLQRLAEAGAAPAAVVLARASDLPADFLLARAERGDAAEALAIAGRRDLDRLASAALARRPEPEVLRALAANQRVALDRGALVALTQRGRFDLELGRALIARGAFGPGVVALFLAADPPTRRMMMRDAERAALADRDAGGSTLEAARGAALDAARAGDRRGFCMAIARALRAGRSSIEGLVEDSGGEPLGLLFAAMGLGAAESASLFVRLRPDLASSVDSPVSGARIAMATSASAALRIVAAIAHGQPQPERVGEYRNRDRVEQPAPRGLPRAIGAPRRNFSSN